MGAARKIEEQPAELPNVDLTKPVRMRYWQLPQGTFVGASSISNSVAVLPVPSRVSNGFDIDGVVEAIELHPNGIVVAFIRCGTTRDAAGELRQMFFVGGQGAPL